MLHSLNWCAGWCLILVGFLAGAVLGLFFGREDFLGGYASWRRRLLRLGHIALVALGLLNVVYALAPWPTGAQTLPQAAGWALAIGGLAMPAVCFLAAWRKPFKGLFFIPVSALLAAVVMILAASLAGGAAHF